MLCSIEYVISNNVGKCKSNCILCSTIIKYWDLLSDMHYQSLKISYYIKKITKKNWHEQIEIFKKNPCIEDLEAKVSKFSVLLKVSHRLVYVTLA